MPPMAAASSDRRPTTIYLVDKPGAAQSVITAAQLTVERTHPDYPALVVMNMAFGGQFTARLNMNLREDKGYTYGYRSRFDWRRSMSNLSAGGSVQTAVTKEALYETLKEFRDLHGDRPIVADEFQFTRAWLQAEAARLASPRSPAYQLGRQLNLPPAYLLIHRVTLGSIGVLCQLEAKAPYRGILERWLPGFATLAAVANNQEFRSTPPALWRSPSANRRAEIA